MKKNKNLSLLFMSITTLVLGICSILIPGNQAQAAELKPGEASITLHKKQMVKGNLPDKLTQNTGNEMTEFDKYQGFEGVEFSIYDATPEYYDLREHGNGGKGMSSEEAIKRIQSSDGADLEGHKPLDKKVTDVNGDLMFTVDKKIGGKDAVYLIVEGKTSGVIRAANLVVGFPVYEMTLDGKYTDNELTNIHIYPKNQVSDEGSIEVIKKASYDNSIYLDGAEFVVSKKSGGKDVYIESAKDGMYTWTETQKDAKKFITGNTYNPGTDSILVTEETGTGKLIINHISVGKYTVIETKAPDGSAMINDQISKDVEVGKDGNMTAEIDVINDKIKLDKTSDSNNQSVEIGKKIEYNIESTIPQGIQDTFEDGTRRYTSYKLIDKHSEELTFVNDSKVENEEFGYELKDGNKVIAPENYTITEDADKKGFTLEINADYLTELTPNGKLTFDYFMFLNEKAVPCKDYTNTANVETGDLTDKTKPVTVKTGGAMFQKIDQDNKNTGLKDAKFVIQNETKDKYAVVNETTKEVTWTTDKNQATVFTSGKDGNFEVIGLEFGTYYLVETEAPEGYVLLKNPIKFTVDDNSYNKKQTVEVVNKHKGSLPMTGGIGSIVFVVGGISAFGFAALYFKKRLSESK